jgi:hypothetical protein
MDRMMPYAPDLSIELHTMNPIIRLIGELLKRSSNNDKYAFLGFGNDKRCQLYTSYTASATSE